MPKHQVTTLAEWIALPDISVPTDSRSGGKGARYMVLKVGLFLADPNDCEKNNLSADSNNPTGKCMLPTAFIQEKDGSQKLYKLPISLQDWAIDLVALVHSGFKKPFPCNVEFGLKDDRIYAEII